MIITSLNWIPSELKPFKNSLFNDFWYLKQFGSCVKFETLKSSVKKISWIIIFLIVCVKLLYWFFSSFNNFTSDSFKGLLHDETIENEADDSTFFA